MSVVKEKPFKKDTPPVWCPGCGNYGVLAGVYKALEELGIPHFLFLNKHYTAVGESRRRFY